MKNTQYRQAIYVGIVVSIILIIVDFGFGFSMWRQYKSGEYIQASGVILRSYTNGWTGHHGHNDAIIRFTYKANGESFESSRYRYLIDYSFENAASLVSRFPIGTKVSVYFNPANPSDAVLSPGLARSDVLGTMPIMLLIGHFFVTVIWLYAWFAHKQYKKNVETSRS
jgi:hypothetical protein